MASYNANLKETEVEECISKNSIVKSVVSAKVIALQRLTQIIPIEKDMAKITAILKLLTELSDIDSPKEDGDSNIDDYVQFLVDGYK